MIEEVQLLVTLAKTIYTQIKLVKDNKEQCEELKNQIMLIMNSAHALDTTENVQEHIVACLRNLASLFRACLDFINQYSGRPPTFNGRFWQVVNARSDNERFKHLHKHLLEAAQLLSHALVVGNKQDTEDFRRHYAVARNDDLQQQRLRLAEEGRRYRSQQKRDAAQQELLCLVNANLAQLGEVQSREAREHRLLLKRILRDMEANNKLIQMSTSPASWLEREEQFFHRLTTLLDRHQPFTPTIEEDVERTLAVLEAQSRRILQSASSIVETSAAQTQQSGNNVALNTTSKRQRYAQAEAALATGDYTRAYAFYQEAVNEEENGISACYMLGKFHTQGSNIPNNPAERDLLEAHKWFLLAARQGHCKSMCQIAKIFAYGNPGEEIETDHEGALEWAQKAVIAAKADDERKLARETLLQVERKVTQAHAETGDVVAMHKLAVLLWQRKGIKTPENAEQARRLDADALRWATCALQQGDASARALVDEIQAAISKDMNGVGERLSRTYVI